MSSLKQLRLRGNEHFDAGRLSEAIECFHDVVDLFVERRSTETTAIAEFVKTAGNLCVCYRARGELDTCVRTARELIGVYPIIPKAYGAIGMCIVDRLTAQEDSLLTGKANTMGLAGATSETAVAVSKNGLTRENLRSDPRRYITQLGGVRCSVDDAHTNLCRAILLSGGSLQVSLGPFVATAVRLISEQTISGSYALEWEHGDDLLDRLCPLEERPTPLVPACLSTAPPAMRNTVRAMDPSRGVGETVPRRDAAAILAHAAAEQQQQQQQQQQQHSEGEQEQHRAANTVTERQRPIDYALSGRPTEVRVCHAERGGLPRALAVARAIRPFAVAAWATGEPHISPPQHQQQSLSVIHTTATSTAVGAQKSMTAVTTVAGMSSRGRGLADPEADRTLEAPSHDVVMQHLEAAGNGTIPMPATIYCAHCGREVKLAAMMAGTATSCVVCGAACYCSSECEEAHRPQHDSYECKLRVKLQELLASYDGCEVAACRKSVSAEDADMPGSAWSTLHMLRHTLPLSIAIYGSLCARAEGYERVLAQLKKGSHRWALAALPTAITDTICTLAALVAVNPLADAGTVEGVDASTDGLLRTLVLMARMHACPPPTVSATDADRGDHPFSFFYTERLLFRHSCEPNCVWVGPLRAVVTGRLIVKGEELTLAVDTNESSASTVSDGNTVGGSSDNVELFPQHWPWQIRRKWLLRHHAFDCGCARCEREESSLNTARGDLSNDTIEQLLTGDRADRPKLSGGEASATTGVGGVLTHPTHHFHPRVQRAITESYRTAAVGTDAAVKMALRGLESMSREAAAHLLPTHYLFEDLRAAVKLITSASTVGEGKETVLPSTACDSLLFYEAMWPGAIPRKGALAGSLPTPSQSRRSSGAAGRQSPAAAAAASDRRHQPAQHQTQSASLSAAEVQTGKGSEDASASELAASPADTRRRRRVRPQPTRDYSKGSIVDQFCGSYQAWYAY